MDKNNNSRDEYLRHLNKLSHKISKPTPTPSTTNSNSNSNSTSSSLIHKKPSPLEPPNPAPPPPPPPPQHQPPVYNINKSDFRDVVQKLTGSPAHDNITIINNSRPSQSAAGVTKPAVSAAAATSRLHRIRPPPLSHLAEVRPQPGSFSRAPLSPLPPLPSVHGAAESPVSAYMRYLHSSMATDSLSASGFPPLESPRWSNLAPPMATNNNMMPPPPPPPPPIPFGCLNSPRSPSSSGQLGFPQLPLSPTVPPMPSPRWRGF